MGLIHHGYIALLASLPVRSTTAQYTPVRVRLIGDALPFSAKLGVAKSETRPLAASAICRAAIWLIGALKPNDSAMIQTERLTLYGQDGQRITQ
jgi:hypothetical protein